MLPKDKGAGRRVQRQDRVLPVHVHQRPRPVDCVRCRSSTSAIPRGSTTPSPRASIGWTRSTAAASCWSSPTATTPAAREQQGNVLEQARDEEVMIYAIGLRSDYFNGSRQVRSEAGLRASSSSPKKPAAATSSSRRRATSRRRSRASRRSCTASTCSASRRRCSTERCIGSRCAGKKPGMTVRARRSYLASADVEC